MIDKKFLASIGVTEEDAVNKVLAQYNTDIKAEKSQLEDVQKQLQDANTQIENFKGMNIEDIKKSADEWKEKFEKSEQEHKTKIADMEFDTVLNTAISSVKAKNSKSVKALLDLEALKSSKNQADDIKKALEQIKSENDYLFEGTNIPGGGGNPPHNTNTNTNPLPKGTIIF